MSIDPSPLDEPNKGRANGVLSVNAKMVFMAKSSGKYSKEEAAKRAEKALRVALTSKKKPRDDKKKTSK